MNQYHFTEEQQRAVDFSLADSLFIDGPVSHGKTTAAISRLERLLKNNAYQNILILTPQRSLSAPYLRFLDRQDFYKGSKPAITTISGFARLMVSRFWLLISKDAGFANPHAQPHFLSLETAQYIMGNVLKPFLLKGYFNSITIEKSRLYSQILDNLNKTAVVPFPHDEIANRLRNSAGVDGATILAFDQAQECALEFRKYCLKNNLIDFSLLIDVFRKSIWKNPVCQSFVKSTYQALIIENIEEDFPVSHDIYKDFINLVPATTIILDSGGGFRSFLGADPESAYGLRAFTASSITFSHSFELKKSIESFSLALGKSIMYEKSPESSVDFSQAYEIDTYRFVPQMISQTCEKIAELISENGTKPQEIAILAPYISDAVRFTFAHELDKLRIPNIANRPSQIYMNHPVIRALLTISKLTHPQWPLDITRYEIRDMLLTIIDGLDLVRADLITQVLFSQPDKHFHSYDEIQNIELQERITFQFGEIFEKFLSWTTANMASKDEPLDIFFSRLFGELLSIEGFGFFRKSEPANVITKLIQSIRSFREFSINFLGANIEIMNLEYIQTLEDGLLPSSFFNWNNDPHDDVVQIEPAHTFLTQNRKCEYQFWLDAGSLGWWERLNQPLTNPYLLRRRQNPASTWSDSDEFKANQISMKRIVQGLINRCNKKIFISIANVNEYGNELKGPLLFALQNLQKQVLTKEVGGNV